MSNATLTYADKTLTLPVNPQEVSWTYSMKSNTTKTYGGVIIQILGYSIDRLNIIGQLPVNDKSGNRFAFLDRFQKFISSAMLWQQGTGQGSTEERHLTLSIPSLARYNVNNLDFADGYKFKVLLSSYPNITRDIKTSVPTYSLAFDVVETTSALTALTRDDAIFKNTIGQLEYTSGVQWSSNKYNDPRFNMEDPSDVIPAGEVISDKKRDDLVASFTKSPMEDTFAAIDDGAAKYPNKIPKITLGNGGTR